VLGCNYLKAVNRCPLSNSTVSTKIDVTSCNIKRGLIHRIKKGEGSAMRVDDTVVDLSIMFSYMRYVCTKLQHKGKVVPVLN
jgi:hypothetical protein